MADEQTPPKRDVDKFFTLDASAPSPDFDGPLAHLMSDSPVADLGGQIGEPVGVDGGPPSIADVAGLEDIYTTTADLPPTAIPARPVDPPAGEPGSPLNSTQSFDPVNVDMPRPFAVGEGLRFSVGAEPRMVPNWSEPEVDERYPAVLVPNAVPAPVSPSKSVRVPGQERRRGAVVSGLVDLTERRWFWGAAGLLAGLACLVLIAAGNLVPNPLADDRPDVVADIRVPAAPASGDVTDTSTGDTSSSAGAGSSGLDPESTSSSIESDTTTSSRRITTTVRQAVRSTAAEVTTTTEAPSTTTTATTDSTTTTAESTTTAVDSSSSSTTDTSGSTTTDPDGTTTTDDTSTTETTEGDTTTTVDDDDDASSSSDDPDDP